jgi:hypothetical protein
MSQTSFIGNPAAQHGHQPLVQPTALTAATGSSIYGVPKFNGLGAIGIGTTLIVAAYLGMIMNVMDAVNPNDVWNTGHVGHGFWVGAVVSIIQRCCLVDKAT